MSISSLAAAVMILPMIPPITAIAGTTVRRTRDRSQFWQNKRNYFLFCISLPVWTGRQSRQYQLLWNGRAFPPSKQKSDQRWMIHLLSQKKRRRKKKKKKEKKKKRKKPSLPSHPASCLGLLSSCSQSRPLPSHRTMTSPRTSHQTPNQVTFEIIQATWHKVINIKIFWGFGFWPV